MLEKIKQFIESDKGKDILTMIIVVLVAISSFGLGRLSKDSENKGLQITEEAKIQQAANVVNTPIGAKQTPSSGSFFASKRGHKYYKVGCSAGQTIKQENRIYFGTREDAERAGYELSTSCR